jgi:isoleucyl-tRNA synthetase
LIGRLQDAYRKIRNTLRYLLGNTSDFDPGSMAVAYEDMSAIDQWAVSQYQKLIAKVTNAYDNFAFHRVYTLIYNFCTVEMSSIYMDVLKDRLYCDGAASQSRRSAQTAMSLILDGLVRMLAPVLVHTCEEAWGAIGHKSEDADSVHLASMPRIDKAIDYKAEQDKWDKIMDLRDRVMVVLEEKRQQQEIRSNQEASVDIVTDDRELVELIGKLGNGGFAALCIVSEVKVEEGCEVKITAAKSSYGKCDRCWNYWPSVGGDDDHPELCSRCSEVLKAL